MNKKLLFIPLAALSIFLVALIGYMMIIFVGNYVIDEEKLVFDSATSLVDEEGRTISKMYREDRELVHIDEIPLHVQRAFVAVEDARFYEHSGIDMKAICRALYKDLIAREKVEGGSTITQQLVKNVFLSHDKTVLRKTKEIIIALNLERKYTKDQILEMYLNQIYFGHGAYGIQSASKAYFSKDVSELTVDEGAVLAALPKAPNSYSPINNYDKSIQRRNIVLSLMKEQGYMTPEEMITYQGHTIALKPNELTKEPAFATYVDMILDEAEEKYHLSRDEVLRGGYTIRVPMKVDTQKIAHTYFEDVKNFPGKDDEVQGAFVLMDSKTGGIQAAIGGRKYVRSGTNRVNVRRQPGSTIKPFLVYGPALETGNYTPYSLLRNEKLAFGDYEPKNYDNHYSTDITMYDAIKTSANVPAVWLLNEIGINYATDYLTKIQMPLHEKDKGLSMALGGFTEGYSPLEMMKAYGAFSEDGTIIEPYVIAEITDRHGSIVGKNERKETEIFSKQTAWNMTRMLEGVVKEGTAQHGSYQGALAGKTGTTNMPSVKGGTKDAWFVGYTPDVVGTMWMGYDRSDENHHLIGGSNYPTALMKKILTHVDKKPTTTFTKPEDVDELDKPIRVKKIEDVEGSMTFTPTGLFTAKLSWTPLEDKRVQYNVYRVEGETATLEGSVTGEGEFQVKFINIFDKPSFYVVPYNSQTNQEGEKSNIIKP